MWGMCRCGRRRDLNAQGQDLDRPDDGRGRHGESFPAPAHASERMNAALRSAVQLAGLCQSRRQYRALFPLVWG